MRVKINLEKVMATVTGAMPARVDKKRIVRGLGAMALQYWKKQAQAGLRSSSRDYLAALQLSSTDEKAFIILVGMIPNMIENGWKGGDLRQWLLVGKNAKQGKNGPYNTIPFRHGTPGSGGRNVGNAMPESIYQVARKLAPTLSRPGEAIGKAGGQTTVWGQRLHPGLPMKEAARKILARVEKPWHATSIYMNMVRKAQPIMGGTKLQTSGYTTFRRISKFSRDKKRHWIHPGIQARRYALQTRRMVERLAMSIVLQSLQGKKR
jgi:hypothetical protein